MGKRVMISGRAAQGLQRRVSPPLYWLAICWLGWGCATPSSNNEGPDVTDASVMMDTGTITDASTMVNVDMGLTDMAVEADMSTIDASGPEPVEPDMEIVPDAELMPETDADLCPPIDQRPEPSLVDRFEDGSPEVELRAGPFVVIAPEGHEPLAQHTLDALPGCHAVIEAHMGYCHPWREAIIHYGRFEPSRAKAEEGVVYIGRSEASLMRLHDPEVWREAPAICGGQSTFAHESIHTFQPADLPAWLKEGWADYFGKIIVSGNTYECGETSVCIRPPNTGGRPQPDECPSPIEYWDLSDPDWGVRPDPNDEREGGESGESNKGRYYKTGTCFWQTIRDAYGEDALRAIFRDMHLNPRDDLPVFPFSVETNDLLIRSYFEPIVGPEVWALVAPYGIRQLEP